MNFFDTADVYSDGESEQVLGEAVRGRRDRIILSTKTGLRLGDGVNDVGASRARLMRAVDASLRRLGTDYIDLLQLHAFDAHTPLGESLRALDDLVKAGKLRHVGVSSYAGWQLMTALTISWGDQQGRGQWRGADVRNRSMPGFSRGLSSHDPGAHQRFSSHRR